jgi:hypothetical protein
MAVDQSVNSYLTHRIREQARSHILIFSVADIVGATTISVGAGLARDGGVSVDEVLSDPPPSQASQFPYFELRQSLERYVA